MSDILAIVLLLVCIAAMLVVVRGRRALVMSLPFLVTLNGLPVAAGPYSLRLDQLVACALMLPLAAAALSGSRPLRLDATSWWLMGLLALNILSSALESPVPAYSLAQCANLASSWSIYVIVINAIDDRRALGIFLLGVLRAAIFASAIGVGAFVLALAGAALGGAEVSTSAAENLTTAYGAFGTMVEPNILGSFTAAYLVLSVVLLAGGLPEMQGRAHPRTLRWAAALTALCLLLTFTRAAWLAAIAGIACVALLADGPLRARFRPATLLRAAAVIAATVSALLLMPGDVGTLFRFKVTNLLNPGSQTAIVRLYTYVLALEQTSFHPLLGNGTFSFAPLAAQGADFRQFENWRHLWIGNYLLLALHDTGLLGLLAWLAMLGNIVRRSLAAMRNMPSSNVGERSIVVGLLAACITLFVAFLSTSGFSLGYSWLLLGLLAAATRLASTSRPGDGTASA